MYFVDTTLKKMPKRKKKILDKRKSEERGFSKWSIIEKLY